VEQRVVRVVTLEVEEGFSEPMYGEQMDLMRLNLQLLRMTKYLMTSLYILKETPGIAKVSVARRKEIDLMNSRLNVQKVT
jgi:hypothetical protein